jgi:hypothetical protein
MIPPSTVAPSCVPSSLCMNSLFWILFFLLVNTRISFFVYPVNVLGYSCQCWSQSGELFSRIPFSITCCSTQVLFSLMSRRSTNDSSITTRLLFEIRCIFFNGPFTLIEKCISSGDVLLTCHASAPAGVFLTAAIWLGDQPGQIVAILLY